MNTNNNVTDNRGIVFKYGSLVAFTTSFLLLVVALSSITYLTSQQVEKSTREFDIASRQTVLAQQLSKNLLDTGVYARDLQAVAEQLKNAEQATLPAQAGTVPATEPSASTSGIAIPFSVVPQSAIYNLQELKSHSQIFTDNLKAFKEGGVLKDGAGQEIAVQAVTDPKLRATLAKIEAIWTPYLGLLNNFSEDVEKGVISKQTSDFLTDYTRMYNSALQAETTAFASRQNEMIQASINRLSNIQIFGVGIAFLLFVGIVFGALQRLVRSDRQLAKAQRQTDDIMNTVNEGLFLIDKDLVIADKYSGKLEEILHKKDIAGKTLYQILEGMISQKDMDTTKLFVEQLYNTWVVEELIQDLNPLKQVLLTYIDENGVNATKFLEFNFLRVLNEQAEKVDSVFVSVIDITTAVNLQNQMQKDKEQHNRQIEMISYLLSVDGTQLAYFMKETKARIERMNDVLRHRDTGNLREKAEQLYREMHSLKGDASAVNLGALVDIAIRQEDRLKQLLQQTILKGNDFLPFTVGLDEMVSMVSFIDNLLQRLNLQGASTAPTMGLNQAFLSSQNKPAQSANSAFSGEIDFGATASQKGYWEGYYEQYAHAIAERQGKEIDIVIEGFDGAKVDDSTMSAYKDIAVQLLKNAIVHGIESPSVRASHNKPSKGSVTLSLQESANEQKIVIKDDGAGINWEKIRQKAVEIGQYSEAEANALSPKDLLRLMFVSGVSTADKTDEDAGRGVGMDIVSQLASDHRAKISVNSRPDEFTEIGIAFPKAWWVVNEWAGAGVCLVPALKFDLWQVLG